MDMPVTRPREETAARKVTAGNGDGHRQEMLQGLLQRQARIAPKFLYDAQGCALYGAICELREYYPTRTEAAIFDAWRSDIARHLPAGAQWVDLGCGDGAKSRDWLGVVDASRYIAVDISDAWLQGCLKATAERYPGLETVGVTADFSQAFALHPILAERDAPAICFYPGSSIGNFTPQEALAFLRTIRGHLDRAGRLLIGVDLVKDKGILEAAYDDALGVTAAFNRNVLRVANGMLDASFDPRRFRHRAVFDAAHSRIEMRLEAMEAHSVRLGSAVRNFEAGESILTEYSYKYTLDDFGALLEAAGFGGIRHWSDARGWFAVVVARPAAA